jgi:outer membrane protein assembly factor BamB
MERCFDTEGPIRVTAAWRIRSLPSVAVVLVLWGCASPRPETSTRVVRVRPGDGAVDVDVQKPVELHFSNGLTLSTITARAIRLLDAAGKPVPVRLGSDIEGDVVNIQPLAQLEPRSSYRLEVNGGLHDKHGAPVARFESAFTTGEAVPRRIPGDAFRYKKSRVDDEPGPTAIAVGPDGHVYVSTYYGSLYRLQIEPGTGRSIGKQVLLALPGRKILGLAFDPGATASDPVAWITHDDRKAEAVDQGTLSGVVARVAIPPAGRGGVASETRYIVGLPSGWHPLNGGAFGPDGRLYISIGSMNRLGHDPIRPEMPLSAAVVVADVRRPGWNGGRLPLDVQTTAPTGYDPHAAAAPLKLYATGFRQMYRLCWHSNGSLYGGVNQNDGTERADTPSCPGVPSLRAVFPDEALVRIVEGGYYGHPNPSRREHVLLGGNPTAGVDPWEVVEYPIGVSPEPSFHPANLIFNLKRINGTSADGCAEHTAPGPLQGRLLICFFEGTHTLHTFAFNATGTAVTDERPLVGEDDQALTFTQPLDVAVHPTGRIYVADFGAWSTFGGGGAIWLLEPASG